MAVGVTNHPGSTTAARMEQGGQDPSPSPGQQERVLSPLPGAHTLILNQQQEEKLGDEGERDARRLSSPTTLSAAWSRPLHRAPGGISQNTGCQVLPRPKSSPRDTDGHESHTNVGGELYMWGGGFLGAFSGLSSSCVGAIHCQTLVLARHSLGRDVRYTCPHGSQEDAAMSSDKAVTPARAWCSLQALGRC